MQGGGFFAAQDDMAAVFAVEHTDGTFGGAEYVGIGGEQGGGAAVQARDFGGGEAFV